MKFLKRIFSKKIFKIAGILLVLCIFLVIVVYLVALYSIVNDIGKDMTCGWIGGMPCPRGFKCNIYKSKYIEFDPVGRCVFDPLFPIHWFLSIFQ
jgi:hypothetical protein